MARYLQLRKVFKMDLSFEGKNKLPQKLTRPSSICGGRGIIDISG